MSNTPPFVLVDGSYYLFRTFHALPLLRTSQGIYTNAIRGTLNALHKLMRRFQPTHMAVVFDTPEPTFRHVLSAEYKAHRPSMPSELSEQIFYLHQIIKALGIPLLTLPGAEADDLIGTLARRACREGHHVLISTGDKDMCQLVDDLIILEDSFRDKTMNYQAVVDKFGIRPNQMIDYLTLMGDSSDGIAGIPKIGEKTAAKLLQQYDTIDNILKHVADIKGTVGKSLIEHADKIPLNHQLASIVCDLPLELDWHELKLTAPDTVALKQLYTTLEFKNDLKSLEHPHHPDNIDAHGQTLSNGSVSNQAGLNRNHTPTEPKPLAPILDTAWHTILTQPDFDALLQRLSECNVVAVDTETTSIDWRLARLVGISFAFKAQEAFYVPLGHDYLGAPEQLPFEATLQQLKPFLENPDIGKIGQHLKYDAHVFLNHGIELKGWYFDTMLASYVLNPTITRHNMDALALHYLNYKTTTFEEVAGKGVKQFTFNQIPLEQAAPYACEDADITFRLYETLNHALATQPTLWHLLTTLEMPIAPVLMQMETDGVALDTAFLTELGQKFAIDMQRLEQEAYALAGKEFNIASPKQLGEILYDHLGISGGKKTASGQYATSESVLELIDHPLAATILHYRGLAKLKSTYTDTLVQQADSDSHRVHTSYHQAVTATGRLSSSQPNLQNIPIRDEEGRLIRKAFIAPPGRVIVAADYSQIELRLMAHLSQDAALLAAFKQGLDIHRATAAEVLGIALEDVTGEQRRQAKAINFGLLYGMSSFGLSKQLKLTRAESQQYIARYFSRYPQVLEYMERTREQAAAQGFVSTLLGRRLYTPDIHLLKGPARQAAERAAINAPLQGSAADIIKLAMIAIDNMLPRQQAKMLLQVHDELVFEIDADIAHTLGPQLAGCMGNVIQLDVPLLVEVGYGANWDEAH